MEALKGIMFSASVAAVCDISAIDAKLILYSTLDDGYGTYFHDIFDEADRQSGKLISDIGARLPKHLNEASAKCTELAEQFIQINGLRKGEWHQNWRSIATCSQVKRAMRGYAPGALGKQFMDFCGTRNPAARSALMDALACGDCRRYVLNTAYNENWRQEFTDSQVIDLERNAKEFVALQCRIGKVSSPIIGLTFGWTTALREEWHLYGDLLSTNIFRCEVSDLPWLFGAVNCSIKPRLLKDLYESTWLTVVAASPHAQVIPDSLGHTYLYAVGMQDIVSCKWVAKLPSVLGSFESVLPRIQMGSKFMLRSMRT